MKFDKYWLLVILLLIQINLSGCLFNAGTHGSIKAYIYPVKKVKLQKAIEKVIAENFNIAKGDTSRKGYIVDVTNGENDTLISPYAQEDAQRYLELTISTGNSFNRYTIQYVGTVENWQNDTFSILSIAYAHDKNDNGGSEGNGGFPWYNPSLKNQITEVFEKELLSNVNKELNASYNIEQ